MGVESKSWELIDHMCRLCYGRLLRRNDGQGRQVIHCAECDAEVSGQVEHLCVCGARTPNGRYLLGLRCGVNPEQSAASPMRMVVVQCQD